MGGRFIPAVAVVSSVFISDPVLALMLLTLAIISPFFLARCNGPFGAH